MQEKVMVNDTLESVKGSLSVYATTISECENQSLRSTIQGIRDSCEASQYELYKIAEQKGFYQPAQQASPEDIQQVRTSLQGGQQQGQGMPQGQGAPHGMPQGQGIPQTPQSQGSSMRQPQGINKPQGQGMPRGSMSVSEHNIPSVPQSSMSSSQGYMGGSQGSMNNSQNYGMSQSSMGGSQGSMNNTQNYRMSQSSMGGPQSSMSIPPLPQAFNSIGQQQGMQQF
ncbi:MAG: spore coat protein [Clostridiales bacterium]|nr:spore coat protein [Clostridiales bacterium]